MIEQHELGVTPRPRILVVDDFDDARELYVMAFEDAGFDVAEAANGAEALVAIEARPPDCILMDLAMPVMDGFEATRRIKTDPKTANIVVVVVSGQTKSDDIARARAAGADEVLAKPCLPADFLARASRLVSRWRRA